MQKRRDLTVVGAIWVVVTLVATLVVLALDLHPIPASREAHIVDGAFDFLLLLSVPVFTFVVVVLVYSVVRFRGSGGEGAAFRTNKRFVTIWVAVSSFLAVLVIIHPGLTGLAELEAERDAELTIGVTARQWSWTFEYVGEEVVLDKADELVLPVDTRVRFLVTSEDVIHSFWVPGFRTKIDAVPGRTTEIYTTPLVEGSYDGDPNFRVQCAELCGTGHARMRTDVVVLNVSDFDAWLDGQRG